MTASWISHDRLRAAGCSDRWIQGCAKRGIIVGRQCGKRGRNGKRKREFLFSSLPGEVQVKIAQSHGAAPAVAAAPGIALASLPALVGGQSDVALVHASSATSATNATSDLSDEQKEQARLRRAAIDPLLSWQRGQRDGFNLIGGKPIRTQQQLAKLAAKEYDSVRGRQEGERPTAWQTIYKWLARYCEAEEEIGPGAGFNALANRARSDRGVPRQFAKHPKAAEFALIKYLGLAPSEYLEAARRLRFEAKNHFDYSLPRYKAERLSFTTVHRRMAQYWPEWYPGEKPISESTLRNFIKALPQAVVIMAREGKRAYENKCEPHLVRRYDDLNVMQILCTDHRILDHEWYNDYFPDLPWGAPFRPHLTSFEDLRSRYIVGWAISVHGSSRSAMAALRMAFSIHGLPKLIYMDNGKDYKKLAAMLLENFGIESSFAKPFRPRSKPVESWHSLLAQRLDPLFGSAYVGRDAKNKPEQNVVALDHHQAWLDHKANETPLWPVSKLFQIVQAWLDRRYHEEQHTGQGMNRRTPREVFDAGLPPERRQPLDVARLAPFFEERKTLTVSGCKVKLFRKQYVGATAEDEARLWTHHGRAVRVACNPDDIACALAFENVERDAPLVARLVSPELLSYGPISHAAIAERERRNQEYRRATRSFLAAGARHARAIGLKSEIDLLMEEAGITQPIPCPAEDHLPLKQPAVSQALAPAYPEDLAEEVFPELVAVGEEG